MLESNDKKDTAIEVIQRQLEEGHSDSLLDIIGYTVKARTQEEVSRVINSWLDGELKTLKEENLRRMEEAKLFETIQTTSLAIEEDRYEKWMKKKYY